MRLNRVKRRGLHDDRRDPRQVLVSILLAVAVTAVNGDLRPTERDLDHKQAYEAAEAGIADYAYHLNNDTNYWSKCTAVPTPNAVNQMGSTTNRRTVPGTTGTTYAIELLPATGKRPAAPATRRRDDRAVGNARERSGSARPVIRGSNQAERRRHVQAQQLPRLRLLHSAGDLRPGHLRYTRGTQLAGANSQCSKTVAKVATTRRSPPRGGDYCDRILFASGEKINGPLHTNDGFVITCGTPTFGRTSADAVEIAGPTDDDPLGPARLLRQLRRRISSEREPAPAPVLTPPATNGSLATSPGSQIQGTTDITLSGNSVAVTNKGATIDRPRFPPAASSTSSNGACTGSYSPFAVRDSVDRVQRLRLRQRLRQRQLHGPADDRRRERHHHRGQPLPRHELLGSPAAGCSG